VKEQSRYKPSVGSLLHIDSQDTASRRQWAAVDYCNSVRR